MAKITELHEKIAALVPIDGLYQDERGEVQIHWKGEPTAEQRAAAQGAIADFDINAPEVVKPTLEERLAALEAEVQKLKQAAKGG